VSSRGAVTVLIGDVVDGVLDTVGAGVGVGTLDVGDEVLLVLLVSYRFDNRLLLGLDAVVGLEEVAVVAAGLLAPLQLDDLDHGLGVGLGGVLGLLGDDLGLLDELGGLGGLDDGGVVAGDGGHGHLVAHRLGHGLGDGGDHGGLVVNDLLLLVRLLLVRLLLVRLLFVEVVLLRGSTSYSQHGGYDLK